MERACKASLVLILFFLKLCNALPINLENSGPDSHTQFLTGLVAVLLTVCSVVLLAGCLCCQRRNGFKEFRDSPVAASVANSLDHGHVNPIANSEFTIFTPISPPHHNNNVFLANQRIVSRTQDDYKYGDIDVTYWFDGSEKDFPRKNLKYIKELGKGWFGRVVEGTAQGLSRNPEEWCPVVVRILEASASSRERVLFLYDATIYRCGSHPNILRVLGRSLDTIPLLLLQEYCTEGDLKQYLRNNRATCDKFLSSDYPLLWCYQLTLAVKFLHGCRVTHPDLSARNCQLTKDLQLKLGDYGLSATLYPEDYYEGSPAVPLRWCAPETISYTSTTIQLKQITFEGNIWSLGVTLWEICECGDQPYSWLTDDEVVSQVIETPKVRLPRPSYSTIYTDYLYRLMQSCWLTFESRSSIYQIELMLADLMQVYEHTKVISHGGQASVSMHDFDKRWEALKPNKNDREIEEQDLRSLNALNLHVSNADEILNDRRLSASMNNLHGSLDNLLEYKNSFDPMESWLENVACNTGDMSYVKGLSEAIKDLDNAIAFENVSSDSSHQQSPIPDVIPRQNKLQFKLGQVLKLPFSELPHTEHRTSSESETEDEAWRKKIERGAYSEKVRQKSRSVTDLMVLTHIDCSESDSETTMPSIDYKVNHRNMRYIRNMENSSLKFGSEGNLLNVQDTFQEELRKLQEERRDSLLFVPDNRSQSSCSVSDEVSKVSRDLPNVVASNSPVKKLFEELNNPVDIVPAKQVYNVFNVSVEQKYNPLCPLQNLSAPESKTANQINRIKTTNNISDNNCLITPEFIVRENTDNKCVLGNNEITSSDAPEINTNPEVADNNRVDVCNICSTVSSETSFSVETGVDETKNRLENLISFADTDRNYNQIKQVSFRNQQDLIKSWLAEDVFSINEEETPLKNNKYEAKNELSKKEKEIIKRENSHNLRRDCANFLSSQLHSVNSFDYEIKHQVPKLADIIQSNIKLLDYVIINDKDKLPSNCKPKQANENRVSENVQQKNFNTSISIEDNEHIQYRTSETNVCDTSFLNLNNKSQELLLNKDDCKIFNNRNHDASKIHVEKAVIPLQDSVLLNEKRIEEIGETQIPEVKHGDVQLTEVISERTLNDLNHKFMPITNIISDSYTNVQELQTIGIEPNEQNLDDLFVDSKEHAKKDVEIKRSNLIEQYLSDSDEEEIGIKEQNVKYTLKPEKVKFTEELNIATNSNKPIVQKELIILTPSEFRTPETSNELESKENISVQLPCLEEIMETRIFSDALEDVTGVKQPQSALNQTSMNYFIEEKIDVPQKLNEMRTTNSSKVVTDAILKDEQLEVNKTESKCRLQEEHRAKSNEKESVRRLEGESEMSENCAFVQSEDLNNDAKVELNPLRSEASLKWDAIFNLNEAQAGKHDVTDDNDVDFNPEKLETLKLIKETNYAHPKEEEMDIVYFGKMEHTSANKKMMEMCDSLIKEERRGEKVTDLNFTKLKEEPHETIKESGWGSFKEKRNQDIKDEGAQTVEEEKSGTLQNETAKTENEADSDEMTLKVTANVKESEVNSNHFDEGLILNVDKEEKSTTLQEETTRSRPENEEIIAQMSEVNEPAKITNDAKEIESDSNMFHNEPNLNANEEGKNAVSQEEMTNSRTEKDENITAKSKVNKQAMILNTSNKIEDDSKLLDDELSLNAIEEEKSTVFQEETTNGRTGKGENIKSEVIEQVMILNTINEAKEKILKAKKEKDLKMLQQEATTKMKEEEGANEVTELNEQAKILNTAIETVEVTEDSNSNFFNNEIILNTTEEEEFNTLQKKTTRTEMSTEMTEANEQVKILNTAVNVSDEPILNITEKSVKDKLNVSQERMIQTITEKEENINILGVLCNEEAVKSEKFESNDAEISETNIEVREDPVSLTQVHLEDENVGLSEHTEEKQQDKISHTSINLLDKDTELKKLNSEISLNKTKGLDTSSEKIIDKLTQIIKAEKQKQTEPVDLEASESSRVQTSNFLSNEVQHYTDTGGQQNKPQVQFDLSENQQEISPNSLTHYSAFTGTPGMKRSSDSVVILGASDDYSIDYYSGLKTSTEEADELQFSSNFVQDGTQKPFRLRTSDHSDLKYSLETWDNFLDKTFDDQNSRSTDFSNFSEEPQSLLFLDTENYEIKGKGIAKSEPSPKKDEQVTQDAFGLDVKSEDQQSRKESDGDASWEAGGGWFLHPQASCEEPVGEIIPCQAGTSESYVGFSMDDEIMTALRNELLSKLPHAQRASNDKVEDHEELDDTSEKNEVFVRYNVYSTPLSPIPEETYVDSDESRCVTPQRYDSSDDDNSDWSIQDNHSPYNRTETQSPKDSPAKEQLNRHTPSQDSCCSNDTLFNLEELNAANDHEKPADIAIRMQSDDDKQDEKENSDSAQSQNLIDGAPTVTNEEANQNIDANVNETSTSLNVPKISVHNYIQEFLNNERCSQLDGKLKSEENKSKNEDGSTNSDVYLSVNDNTFTFGQSVAPLNSPEDKPWKELQASFRQYEEDEMIEDKDILEALDESDRSNDGNESNTEAKTEFLSCRNAIEIFLGESPDNTEYASAKDLEKKVLETKIESEVVNDDVDSSSDVDDMRPKILESSSDSYDDMYGPLTDIRFSGPANMELMTTSFNEGTDLMEEQDWDSGSDTRSSSSGEFIWREGEHEASVKALRAAPQSENLSNVAPMEHIQEECESSSCTSDSEAEEECPEFVPSAWDKYATPTKSALRSPEKSLERTEKGKKSKGVWFKKQKYHCVYEYPREPESPLLQSYDLWQPTPDYSTIADWDLDSNSYLSTALDEPDCAQDYEVKNDKYPKNLYHLTTFPDLTMGTTMLEEDFFISSSSRPFDMLGGLTSQFFPGKQFLDNWNENATPDSGVEDIIPVTSLTDDKETQLQVPTLKSLAAAIAKQNENRNTVLGGLRHTRNKLKLDLPPSPSAFTSSRTFTVEPVEEILNRQAPTFTTFGKSRFLVQQVDTMLDDKQSENVSFEAIPYKPAKQFYKNDFDREKHKVEIVKGEASLLDSADEDSGIESCTLERKKGVDV